MKEITRINLAAIPYNIEIESKKELEHYCNAIEKELDADSDAMREIEARMVELLADRGVTGEKVITAADITALRQTLGEAKEFASETDSAASNGDSGRERPVKRLMRDTTNRVLGGVCSGIAAYFNRDAVIVRVVAIVILVASFGFAIPVYVLLWLVIPPARTAADRLQMAGKPVTLEGIRDESESSTPLSEPVLVMFLRYLAVGILLLWALGTVVGMAYVVTEQTPYELAQTPEAIAFTVITGMSGVFLVALLAVAAYALIKKKFTQRIAITMIVIMLAGLSSFATGFFGLRDYTDSMATQLAANERREAISGVQELVGAKHLVLELGDAQLNYLVSTSALNGEMLYDGRNLRGSTRVSFERTGDTVTMKANPQSTGCMGGLCMPTTITISGPALDSITVNRGVVYYENLMQDSITFRVSESASLSLAATQPINTVRVEMKDEAHIDLSRAAVSTIEGAMQDQARLLVGNSKSLILTAPAVCPTGGEVKPTISYDTLESFTINGKTASYDNYPPCVTVFRSQE